MPIFDKLICEYVQLLFWIKYIKTATKEDLLFNNRIMKDTMKIQNELLRIYFV